jgi:hypothetical protein
MRTRPTAVSLSLCLSLLLGVQLMPTHWVRRGEYIVPTMGTTDEQSAISTGQTSSAWGLSRDGQHYRGSLGTPWGSMNDALPYEWAKKFWLCGNQTISMAGTGLYWQDRPLLMCIF